jgi:hypothetical protein
MIDMYAFWTKEEMNMFSFMMPGCEMCEPYNQPGFVINAHQWVMCWGCSQKVQAERITHINGDD